MGTRLGDFHSDSIFHRSAALAIPRGEDVPSTAYRLSETDQRRAKDGKPDLLYTP
jgi:hypothetical protein